MLVSYSPKSLKQLQKIHPRDAKKVSKKFELLKSNPMLGKLLSGDFRGSYSLRAWPLRIIYDYNPEIQEIKILDIDYRGGVYKKKK